MITHFITCSVYCALLDRCTQLSLGAEADKTELDKLRRQVTLLQQEMENALLTTERKARAAQQKDRQSNQVHAISCHRVHDQFRTLFFCRIFLATYYRFEAEYNRLHHLHASR